MIKEIRFNGITADSSPYDCPDSDLDIALNLVAHSGHLEPLHAPPAVQLPQYFRPVGIHRTAEGDHILGVTGTSLYWIPRSQASSLSYFDLLYADAPILHVSALGNILAVATAAGIRFARWAGDRYQNLGYGPDFPVIEFALDRPSYAHTIPLDIATVPTDLSTEENKLLYSDTVMGAVLKAHANHTECGHFTQPFLVRYALRLHSGLYICHSAPVLMLPCCLPVWIGGTDSTTQKPTNEGMQGFQLQYMVHSCGDLVEKWKDIVASIDIFVSAPIWTFDQSATIDGSDHHYYNKYNGVCNTDAHNYIRQPRTYVSGKLPLNPNFDQDVQSCSSFYHIASIPIDDNLYNANFDTVPVESGTLSSLQTRAVLPVEFRPHHRFIPERLTAYNSRLHLVGLAYKLPDIFPIASTITHTSYPTQQAKLIVRLNIGGRKYTLVSPWCQYAFYEDGLATSPWMVPQYFYYPDPNAYEAVITDGSYQVTLPLRPHGFLDGAYYYRPLDEPDPQHVECTPANAAAISSPPVRESIDIKNKVYVSEVDCPWLYNAASVVSLPFGTIKALASAARALSQGQFGQFPLYAFTDEGVWALETNAQGTYSARQPITRDVCSDPDAITQLDSSVVFSTARGLMLLSGSQTESLTDIINGPVPDLAALPHLTSLLSQQLNNSTSSLFTLQSYLHAARTLYDYTHQRLILYNPDMDYAYVFNMRSKLWTMLAMRIDGALNTYPDCSALGTGSGGRYSLHDFSADAPASSTPAVLVTRPLKLDAPDILKTVDTAIVRGNFRSDHVRTVLYGSRDLIHWFAIASSLNNRISGFSGTPYKYFRIVVIASLSPGESISSVSLSYNLRFTNRIR